MALKIGISSYVSGGFLSPVIWRLYETGSGSFVDEHQELGPHGVVYNFDFTQNLRDIIYTVKLFEQPGGTGIGTLIKSHDISVSTSTLTFDTDIELIVDGGNAYDPIGGQTTSPPNPNLVGKDFYIEERSIGKLRDQRSIEVTIDNSVGNGTFTLVAGTFNSLDTFIVKIRPQFVVNPAGSQGLSIYKDIVLLTADTVLTGLDFGKLFIVDGVGKVVTITLPPIANILEKLPVWIQSVGTVHNNVVIKANSSETINGNGINQNTFILSKAMRAEIVLLGGVLYGNCDDSDINCRCKIEHAHMVGVNRLQADGSSVLISEYPGLKQAFDNLPASSVCTYTEWNNSISVPYVLRVIDNFGTTEVQESKTVFPSQGKWAISFDGLSIMLPNLLNKFVRGLKSTLVTDGQRLAQGAGGYQVDDFKGHSHTAENANSDGGYGKFTTGGDAPEGGNLYTRFSGGSETRGENIGLIPTIIF